MDGKTLALTPRDHLLLQEVQRCGLVTRDYLLRRKLFSSKTRANERLRRLTQGGYLQSHRQPLIAGGPRLVYFPGRLLRTSGSQARARDSLSGLFLEHQLGLLDVRTA